MEMLEGIISGNQKFAFFGGATPPCILNLGWARSGRSGGVWESTGGSGRSQISFGMQWLAGYLGLALIFV